MNLPNSSIKKLTILIVVLILLACAGFFLSKWLIGQTNTSTDYDKFVQSAAITTYPEDKSLNFTLGGKNVSWSARIFQAEVVEYIQEEGRNFVVVKYFNKNLDEVKAKILLTVKDSDISSIIKKADKNSDIYNNFYNRYVNMLTVFTSSPSNVLNEEYVNMSVEQFKSNFPSGTILVFKLFSSYPDASEITKSKICDEISYKLFCGIAQIQESFNENLVDFWNNEYGKDIYLVPIQIYNNIIETTK